MMKSQMIREVTIFPTDVATIAAAASSALWQRQPPLLPPHTANVPQQRHLPVLSPPLCHNGGASRACCRFMWRKSHYWVALPVFAAIRFGDKFAIFANKKRDENTVFHPA